MYLQDNMYIFSTVNNNEKNPTTNLPHHRILYRIQIYRSFVGEVVEDIGGSYSFGSTLFVAKDEVNPLVELA